MFILKDQVEVNAEAPLILAEEEAELRIDYVRMHGGRVEVIGQVVETDRDAHGGRVFEIAIEHALDGIVDPELADEAGVEREELRESRLVRERLAEIILSLVEDRVRQPRAPFHQRRDARLPRQL